MIYPIYPHLYSSFRKSIHALISRKIVWWPQTRLWRKHSLQLLAFQTFSHWHDTKGILKVNHICFCAQVPKTVLEIVLHQPSASSSSLYSGGTTLRGQKHIKRIQKSTSNPVPYWSPNPLVAKQQIPGVFYLLEPSGPILSSPGHKTNLDPVKRISAKNMQKLMKISHELSWTAARLQLQNLSLMTLFSQKLPAGCSWIKIKKRPHRCYIKASARLACKPFARLLGADFIKSLLNLSKFSKTEDDRK